MDRDRLERAAWVIEFLTWPDYGPEDLTGISAEKIAAWRTWQVRRIMRMMGAARE